MTKKKFILISTVVGFVLFASFFVFADFTGNLLPVSDGSYLQWTPKSGVIHYTNVDESVCNGVTDYNYTMTTGSRDSYHVDISSIPTGSTITQIDIMPCASQNSMGGFFTKMDVFYRFNGANSIDAGNYSLTGITPSSLATTTFGNLSLQKNATGQLEIGVVLTSGNKGIRLSRIATRIYHTSTNPTPTPPLDSTPPLDIGADVSTLNQLEDSGAIYRDDGIADDALKIFKNHNLNSIRLRILVNPPDGYNDLSNLLTMAQRIKSLGFKFLLDFHYADIGTDGGNQTPPSAWSNYNLASMKNAVYQHTKDTLNALK